MQKRDKLSKGGKSGMGRSAYIEGIKLFNTMCGSDVRLEPLKAEIRNQFGIALLRVGDSSSPINRLVSQLSQWRFSCPEPVRYQKMRIEEIEDELKKASLGFFGRLKTELKGFVVSVIGGRDMIGDNLKKTLHTWKHYCPAPYYTFEKNKIEELEQELKVHQNYMSLGFWGRITLNCKNFFYYAKPWLYVALCLFLLGGLGNTVVLALISSGMHNINWENFLFGGFVILFLPIFAFLHFGMIVFFCVWVPLVCWSLLADLFYFFATGKPRGEFLRQFRDPFS